MRTFAFIIALLLLASEASGFGQLGEEFGHLGAGTRSVVPTPAPPETGCVATGVFDLSNVCNDIYFIGGLK
jgi:hypothetical protein